MSEMLYGLTKEEIRHRRDLLMETIRNYSVKHYDARIMLPEYHKLTKWLNANGCKLVDRDYCTDRYWSNPLKYDRQANNKNPVVKVVEGRAIRQFYNGEIQMAKSINTQPAKTTAKPGRKSNNTDKSSYYKIIISWSETGDSQKPYLTKIIKFFDDLGLSQIEKDDWKMCSDVTEHHIAYKFEGTEDGYTMLKRSAMVLLDILNENNNFEIAIHGKKII